MGAAANQVQVLLAYTRVAGTLQQGTFLAHSLASGIDWDLPAHSHFLSSRGVNVVAGSAVGWSSAVGSASFVASGAAPAYIAPSRVDSRAWLQFDGTRSLSLAQGLPSDASVHFVLAPDAPGNWQAVPGATSRDDALRGLTAQRYLLSGNIPAGGASPHFLSPISATMTAQVRWMSHYTHLRMVNNSYTAMGLSKHTGPEAHRPNYRYNVTTANPQSGTPNVERRKDDTLAETIFLYRTRLSSSTPDSQEWRSDPPQDSMEFRENGILHFRERKVRFRLWNKATAVWTFDGARIGQVAPGLTVGSDGIAYFERNALYAPQLGGWATPAGFPPVGTVLSFRTSGLGSGRLSNLAMNGGNGSNGAPAAGGTLSPWHHLGALPGGGQGYSGGVGEFIVLPGSATPAQISLAQNRLAAHYRLTTPDINTDLLPDWWVRFYLAGATSGGDNDNDGLDLATEWAAGTHPNLADTDGDTLSDASERTAGTDPRTPDTDEDGLPDNLDPAPRAPLAPANGQNLGLQRLVETLGLDRTRDGDRDGDGISDFAEWEVIDRYPNDALTDHRHVKPLDDFDGDGVSNLHESEDGTSLTAADDYFTHVVFDRISGSLTAAEWKINSVRGVQSSSLTRTSTTSPGIGVSHHEAVNGTRVRFQIRPLITGPAGDQITMGFFRRGEGSARLDGAVTIRRTSNNQAEIVYAGTNTADPSTPVPVSPEDLLELSLALSPAGNTLQLQKNQVTVFTALLPDAYTLINSERSPLALRVTLHAPGAGLHNLRYRRVHDPDSDKDELPDRWEQKIVDFYAQITNIAQVSPGGDNDDDDLTNLKEYEYDTDPTKRDTDGDGMRDGWEVLYGLDPKNAADGADGAVTTNPNGTPTADLDGDGLSNRAEYDFGSRPDRPSTAGDSFSDAWRERYGLPPTSYIDPLGHLDNDGLTNAEEFALNSNPNAASTAGDGFNDGWKNRHRISPREVLVAIADPDGDGLTNAKEHEIGTHPRFNDTDGDGMLDAWEHAHGAGRVPPLAPPVGLNPLNSEDRVGDPDDDNFDNFTEHSVATDPHDPAANPRFIDADGDHVADYWEIRYGLDRTNPADATYDWDYDGLTNLQEYQHFDTTGVVLDPRPKWREVPIIGIEPWYGRNGDNTLATPEVGSFNSLGQLVKVKQVGTQVVAQRWDPLQVSLNHDGWSQSIIPLGAAHGTGAWPRLLSVINVVQNGSGLVAAITYQNDSGQDHWRLRINDGTTSSTNQPIIDQPIIDQTRWINIKDLRITESGFITAIAELANNSFSLLRWRSGVLDAYPIPRAAEAGFIPTPSSAPPQLVGLSERGEVLLVDYGTHPTTAAALQRFSRLAVGSTTLWTSEPAAPVALGPYGLLPGQTPPGGTTAVSPASVGVVGWSPAAQATDVWMRLHLNRQGDWGSIGGLPTISSRSGVVTVNYSTSGRAVWARDGLVYLIGRNGLLRSGSEFGVPPNGYGEGGALLSSHDVYGNPLSDEFSRPLFGGSSPPLYYVNSSSSDLWDWSSFASDINRHGDLVGGIVPDHTATAFVPTFSVSEVFPIPMEGWGSAYLLQRGRTNFSRVGSIPADFTNENVPRLREHTRFWRINDAGQVLASRARLVPSSDEFSNPQIEKEWFLLSPDNDHPRNGARNGLPDDWEVFHGVSSPEADADADGLSNRHEFTIGTDPKNWDTDGDKGRDSWETTAGFDPLSHDVLDTDKDGIPDAWELANGYDPNDPFDAVTRPFGDARTVYDLYRASADLEDYYDRTEPFLEIISGNNQVGLPGEVLAVELLVKVKRATGAPMVNAPVHFTVQSGGGQILPSFGGTDLPANSVTFYTDDTGIARIFQGSASPIRFIQPITAGVISQITVAARNTRAAFRATTSNDPSAGLSPVLHHVSGNGQAGVPGSFVKVPLRLRVTDSLGNPLPNLPVSFAVVGIDAGRLAFFGQSNPTLSASAILITDSGGFATLQAGRNKTLFFKRPVSDGTSVISAELGTAASFDFQIETDSTLPGSDFGEIPGFEVFSRIEK